MSSESSESIKSSELSLGSEISSLQSDEKEEQAEKAEQQQLLAKSKIIKKKSFTDDNFDEDEPLEQIGVTQFWVASRASKNVI